MSRPTFTRIHGEGFRRTVRKVLIEALSLAAVVGAGIVVLVVDRIAQGGVS